MVLVKDKNLADTSSWFFVASFRNDANPLRLFHSIANTHTADNHQAATAVPRLSHLAKSLGVTGVIDHLQLTYITASCLLRFLDSLIVELCYRGRQRR